RSWMLLSVLVGAVLSLILNNVYPTSLAKHRARGQLQQLETRIGDAASVSAPARAALGAEAKRIRLLLQAVSWFDPKKAAVLQEVTEAIAVLDKSVGVAGIIGRERDRSDDTGVPIRVTLDIDRHLVQAEASLLDGQLDNATSRVADAQQARAGFDAT